MTYAPKFQTCRFCKGMAEVKSATIVLSSSTMERDKGQIKQNQDIDFGSICPCCDGTTKVSIPPYGTGENAKMTEETVDKLAEAITLLRGVGTAMFVEAVANQAARITLPEEVVETYVGYWTDPHRDVNLGEYIMQIAEKAESLAMETYGSLTNGMCAGPRLHVKG
jgi:hypothetical protein